MLAAIAAGAVLGLILSTLIALRGRARLVAVGTLGLGGAAALVLWATFAAPPATSDPEIVPVSFPADRLARLDAAAAARRARVAAERAALDQTRADAETRQAEALSALGKIRSRLTYSYSGGGGGWSSSDINGMDDPYVVIPDPPIEEQLDAAERRRLADLTETAKAAGTQIAQLERAAAELDIAAAALASFDPFLEGTAEVAHNAPQAMAYGREVPVEMVLVPEGLDQPAESFLSEDLPGETTAATGVDLAARMQASLSGGAFRITPQGPQPRRLTPGRPMTWAWTVKPQEFGPARSLTFVLEAVLREAGGPAEVIAQETYRATVRVDVGAVERILYHARRLQPVQAMVGGLVTAALAALTFYFAHLRPRRDGDGDGGGPA